VLSAFLFASIHFQTVALLPIGLLGVVFAFMVQRTGSLYSSMIAHGCYNAFGTLFIVVPRLSANLRMAVRHRGLRGAAGCLAAASSICPPLSALPHTWPAERTRRIWVILSLLVVVILLALIVFADIYVRMNRI